MKKIYLLLNLALFGLLTSAQFNDFTEIELITFESESDYFRQGTPTTNIWQVGQPSKTNFSAAYSAPNAIVTDTLNAYPANNHSWFNLVIPMEDFLKYYESVNISFFHKINTDTLRDGGFITVSYDMGKTWQNIINDTCDWFLQTPKNFGYSGKEFYSNRDTLYNGENGFSGKITNWQEVMFEWVTVAAKKKNWPNRDTMLVRFNFISDDTETLREGWMIDNLRLIVVDHGGTIHDKPLISNLEIYPNPVQTNSIIRSKDQKTIQQILIYNLAGQLLKTSEIQRSEFTFEREGLPPGSYLLKCLFEDNASETIKIILN